MKFWTAISVLTIGSLLIGGFYYLYARDTTWGWKMTPRNEVTEAAIAGLKLRFPPSGQKLYVNEQYLFSLFYPANLEVKEHVEALGTHTVTFEDPTTNQGFQIFITNTSDENIAAALAKRFRIDVPSGIKQNERRIEIANVPSITFNSTDQLLGNTKEVWFMQFAYLYEVTNSRDYEPQVLEILESWQFPEV